MIEYPQKITEFNTITGLIFAQLYKAFPLVINIEREQIAKALDITLNEWAGHKLPSGLTLPVVYSSTLDWLVAEDYVRSAGSHPAERAVLTTKGLAAMNAVPEGLTQPVGTALSKAVENGPGGLSQIGDLIGGMLGGFVKSLSSG